MPGSRPLVLSVMLGVPDARAAVEWYVEAVGAQVQWDLGGVAGLRLDGAPLLVGETDGPGWTTPAEAGSTTTRIEVFVDDPDAFVERAVEHGADCDDPVRTHEMPWGRHRQGAFTDPFGHRWLVGDHAPLDVSGGERGHARTGRKRVVR